MLHRRLPSVRRRVPLLLIVAAALLSSGCGGAEYDLLIRNGTVYDGTGAEGRAATVAVIGDSIVDVADSMPDADARREVDASGLAVAPGFINMLSWGADELMHDGRGLSDLRQGVTLEVFGEGSSLGPLTDSMRAERERSRDDFDHDVTWSTLSGGLETLAEKGVSPNVASFVGATTVREYVMGHECRPPTEDELSRMREQVREAMRGGAMGVGSSLIYEPAFCATTEELTALAAAAGEGGGMYISHMRSEGNRLLESLEELIRISRDADVRAEVYHLKASGEQNYAKLDTAIRMIERARAEGPPITADIYTYVASSTGLDAAMPPWVQEGGEEAWVRRLRDPEIREKVAAEMTDTDAEWDNTYAAAGSPDDILLASFDVDSLDRYAGRTLAEVAEARGTSPEETAMDLVVQNDGDVQAIYFTMSPENLRTKIRQPWVSLCSDASALAPEGVFLESHPHPRAYGSFARLLGRYVREEGVIPLREAIHRLTGLPAENLRLEDRGRLAEGYAADIVVFDPDSVRDHATFGEPHQLATGVRHVFVNGARVIRDGRRTGATPGRVVRGPGWAGSSEDPGA